jgi:hypothetical protein
MTKKHFYVDMVILMSCRILSFREIEVLRMPIIDQIYSREHFCLAI